MKYTASKVEVQPILKGADGRTYRPDMVVTGHGPDGEEEIIVIEAKEGTHNEFLAREQVRTYADIIRDNRNRVVHGMGQLVDTKWFKDKMAEARVSLRQLAPQMGMEPSSLSQTINGKRKLSADEATRLAGFLGVPVEEVLRAAGLAVPTSGAGLVPVVAWLDAGGYLRGPVGLLGPKAVAGPADAPTGLKAIRAQTGGVMDGWLFFYQDATGIPVEAIGRLCVVEGIDDQGPRLRFLQRGYESRRWNLTPMVGEAVESCQLVSAAPVVWIHQ